MKESLNEKISNIVGCNVGGRINFALKLIEEGQINEATVELVGLLMFIREE